MISGAGQQEVSWGQCKPEIQKEKKWDWDVTESGPVTLVCDKSTHGNRVHEGTRTLVREKGKL